MAKARHTTLSAMFRKCLEQLVANGDEVQQYDALMKRLKHVDAGRRFSRDEMNEQ